MIIQVWGRHERCDLEAMKVIARPLMPPRPADAPPEPELWRLGALERMATEAGLVPQDAFDTTWAYSYPDEEPLGRAMVAWVGTAGLVAPSREEAVEAAIIDGLSGHRTAERSFGSRTSSTT